YPNGGSRTECSQEDDGFELGAFEDRHQAQECRREGREKRRQGRGLMALQYLGVYKSWFEDLDKKSDNHWRIDTDVLQRAFLEHARYYVEESFPVECHRVYPAVCLRDLKTKRYLCSQVIPPTGTLFTI